MPNQNSTQDPLPDPIGQIPEPVADQNSPTVTTVSDPQQPDPIDSMPVHNDLPPLPDYMTQSDISETQNTPPPVPQVESSASGLLGSAAPSDLPPMVSSPKKKFGGKKIIATILGIFLLVGGIGAGIVLTQQQQLFQQKATGVDYGGGCITGIHGTTVCGSTNVPYDPNNPPAGENSGYHNEEDAIWGCGGGNYNQGPNGNYYCGGGGGDDGGGGGDNPTPTPGSTIVCQNVKAFKSDSVVPLTSAELSTLRAGDSISFCAFTESTTAKTVTFTINGAAQTPITPVGACMTARGTCFCSDPYTIPDGVSTFNVSALLSSN